MEGEVDVRMTRSRDRLLISGDIGGTKTILGLFALDSPSPVLLMSETYESCRHSCLESMIEAFLAENPASPWCASFAVAGPVRNGSAQVTNLPWCIDAASIKDRFRIPKVFLLNDIEALAWAVPFFDKRKLQTLNVGEPSPHGTIAVVAPGTGCGEAFLVWESARYVAHPSEGGHTDFAPFDSDQIELLRFLQGEFEHVSVERVCSGTGLHHIYRFLRDVRGMVEEPWLSDRFASAPDPAPIISEAALAGKSELCIDTINLFSTILAAEAGNLALKVLASGGVYIGGGIPPRVLPFLETRNFLDAFKRKGRFTALLEKTPLHVVLDTHTVLNGAARRGYELFSI